MNDRKQSVVSAPIRWRAYFVYVLAAAFLCYEMALQASPSVMTHALMRDLGVDAAGLSLMTAFYFYSYTLMQIPAGLLFDRFSARKLIFSFLVVCVLGAVFFGMTTTVYLAAFGRFFMGIGSAFAFIGVLVVAANWFDRKYFAFLVGIAQLLAAMGAMSGQIPLAASVNAVGWRETVTMIAWIGSILAVIIWLVVRDHPPGNPFGRANTHAEQKPPWESIKAVLANPQTWWVALYAFATWAPITAFVEMWGVPYLMKMYDISNTTASWAMAMVWIGLGLSSPTLGWTSDRIGRRRVLLSFSAGIGFLCSLAVLYFPTIPFGVMFALLFGFGFATAGQILSFAVVRDINKPNVMATAIGFNNMAVVAGGALFQPLVGLLLRANWDGTIIAKTPIYTIENYRAALGVVPICFLIAFLTSRFFIKETHCKARYTNLSS